jgi:hypothetical protein
MRDNIDEDRCYLNILNEDAVQAWIAEDNSSHGMCRICNEALKIWIVYSYADGYLNLCQICVADYLQSGMIKSRKDGEIKTYISGELAKRESSVKGIPWSAECFCIFCGSQTRHVGKSFWRMDMNHLFVGECEKCSTSTSLRRDEIRNQSKKMR